MQVCRSRPILWLAAMLQFPVDPRAAPQMLTDRAVPVGPHNAPATDGAAVCLAVALIWHSVARGACIAWSEVAYRGYSPALRSFTRHCAPVGCGVFHQPVQIADIQQKHGAFGAHCNVFAECRTRFREAFCGHNTPQTASGPRVALAAYRVKMVKGFVLSTIVVEEQVQKNTWQARRQICQIIICHARHRLGLAVTFRDSG